MCQCDHMCQCDRSWRWSVCKSEYDRLPFDHWLDRTLPSPTPRPYPDMTVTKPRQRGHLTLKLPHGPRANHTRRGSMDLPSSLSPTSNIYSRGLTLFSRHAYLAIIIALTMGASTGERRPTTAATNIWATERKSDCRQDNTDWERVRQKVGKTTSSLPFAVKVSNFAALNPEGAVSLSWHLPRLPKGRCPHSRTYKHVKWIKLNIMHVKYVHFLLQRPQPPGLIAHPLDLWPPGPTRPLALAPPGPGRPLALSTPWPYRPPGTIVPLDLSVPWNYRPPGPVSPLELSSPWTSQPPGPMSPLDL